MNFIKNIVRKAVSGKRNRLNENGYDLDMTYITPRIIAMSLPAAGTFQKFYRNDINDVA
jgi:phosphatidylinositol-3,4,5-trisphosphate 3-phosphatase/dual-specificity protein phosphatase PTEN